MNILLIAQIGVGIFLTAAILLQSKGTGLGGVFGGNTSYHTRRGMEKSVFYATIVLTVLFAAISIVALLNPSL